MEAIREILNSADTDNLPGLMEQHLQQIIETPQIILGVMPKLTQQTIHFLRGKGVVIFERSKLRNLRGLEIPISETDIDTSQSSTDKHIWFVLAAVTSKENKSKILLQ